MVGAICVLLLVWLVALNDVVVCVAVCLFCLVCCLQFGGFALFLMLKSWFVCCRLFGSLVILICLTWCGYC